MEQPKAVVQITAEPDEVKGRYSNMMQIQHTAEEFVLNFFNIFAPQGALVGRIVISPGHLKRMIKALQENLKKHESAYGDIDEATEPDKPTMGCGSQ